MKNELKMPQLRPEMEQGILCAWLKEAGETFKKGEALFPRIDIAKELVALSGEPASKPELKPEPKPEPKPEQKTEPKAEPEAPALPAQPMPDNIRRAIEDTSSRLSALAN